MSNEMSSIYSFSKGSETTKKEPLKSAASIDPDILQGDSEHKSLDSLASAIEHFTDCCFDTCPSQNLGSSPDTPDVRLAKAFMAIRHFRLIELHATEDLKGMEKVLLASESPPPKASTVHKGMSGGNNLKGSSNILSKNQQLQGKGQMKSGKAIKTVAQGSPRSSLVYSSFSQKGAGKSKSVTGKGKEFKIESLPQNPFLKSESSSPVLVYDIPRMGKMGVAPRLKRPRYAQ